MLRIYNLIPVAWFRAAVAAVAVVLLVACANEESVAPPPAELSPQQVAMLEQRVSERWQALSAQDYKTAWEYSTPVYRSIFPKELYVLQFSYSVERQLTGVEVVHYDAAAAVASVAARVMSKPVKQTSAASRALGAIPVTVNEKWVYVDGNWWHSASD